MGAVTRWPEADIETLKAAHADGLSASQISARFGGRYSRSAVVGMAWRLGLRRERPASPVVKPARPAAPKRVAAPVQAAAARISAPARDALVQPEPPPTLALVAPAPPEVPRADAQPVTARPWITRGRNECAWPIDAPGGETLSCCAAVAGDGPYCAAHRQRAYTGRVCGPKQLLQSVRRYA